MRHKRRPQRFAWLHFEEGMALFGLERTAPSSKNLFYFLAVCALFLAGLRARVGTAAEIPWTDPVFWVLALGSWTTLVLVLARVPKGRWLGVPMAIPLIVLFFVVFIFVDAALDLKEISQASTLKGSSAGRQFLKPGLDDSLKLLLLILPLAFWGWKLEAHWTAFLDAYQRCSGSISFDIDPGRAAYALGAFAFAAHLILLWSGKFRLLGNGKKRRGVLRVLLSAGFYCLLACAAAPRAWLDAGGRFAAIPLLIACWFTALLFFELLRGMRDALIGVGLAAAVVLPPAGILGALAWVFNFRQPLWWAFLAAKSVGLALLAYFASFILIIQIFAAGFYALLGGMPAGEARGLVLAIYGHAVFVAFPVYALGLIFTDRRTLKSFLFMNLPFIAGLAEEPFFEGEGGSAGGAGASAGF